MHFLSERTGFSRVDYPAIRRGRFQTRPFFSPSLCLRGGRGQGMGGQKCITRSKESEQ